ncbi:unnamed protein product [Rotaria sp. Silwood1]|nr:unnamed protein product [Rotaria sp. Silwood1]
MNSHTHIEDLSNEIFFEIFDYLHALDIFTAFNSLNKRISSILQIIPLRILISYDHCYRQINFLSSYLNFHSHQVISIKIYDTIRDYSSIINLLFNRHYFINLQSCIFFSIKPSTKLENVIKQLKHLNRLVSFSIRQPRQKNLNENDKDDLIRTLFMHKSSFLRSIIFQFPYNYLNISNYNSISSNILSLLLWISGSPSTLSVYSILPILRLCYTIRYLTIAIEHEDSLENNHINFSIQPPLINENLLPTLSLVKSFYLANLARFNFLETNNNSDAQQSVNCLSHFVHLSNITQIEFLLSFGTSRCQDIQFILQACPNVMDLIISTEYLLS